MNIVNKLTWCQLMLNKKRTLVTVIGTIISVAMITAVSSLGLSFLDMLRRQVIAESGEWHVLYKNVTMDQVEAIRKDEETQTVILSRDVGYALLEGSRNPNKPYLFIREYNEAGFEKFPVHLLEGRFPAASDEMVISRAILDNGKVDLKIGDTLTLDIGRRELIGAQERTYLEQNASLARYGGEVKEHLTRESVRTFTIVGIIGRPEWEPTWAPGYTVLTFLDEDAMANGAAANASVILKNPDGRLFEHARALAKSQGISEVSFHHELLRYSGVIEDDEARGLLFNLSAIVMTIIIIGSVSLIYNAFAISVSERSKYLGMLSSVGATKKQKRNSAFFEGAVIGSVSIPVGILAGLAGIGLTFAFINPVIKDMLGISADLFLVVSPLSLLAAVAISVLTIFISTWVPARRASNISAIEAIRQTQDYKLTRKAVKTWGLTRMLFGIEGDLGLKNLKRNRTKYKATVFSLVISIVLFLVIAKFTSELKKAVVMTQAGINFDIVINIDDASKAELIAEDIGSLEHIKDFSRIDSLYLMSPVEKEKVPDFLKSRVQDASGAYAYDAYINVLDDASLKTFAEEVGADFNKLKDPSRLSGIVIDVVTYKDMEKDKYVEARVINTRVGEKLNLAYYDSESDSQVQLESLEIAALTDKVPMGVLNLDPGTLSVIISKDVYDRLVQGYDRISEHVDVSLYMTSDDPLRLQEAIEEYMINTETGFSVYNVYLNRQKQEQLLLLMSVFTYGFMILITAICIANILNTISTSIALRKREFAMLKSVDMTPKSFNRMIYFESIFYGIKALLIGLPVSFAVMYLMFNVLGGMFDYAFTVPWASVAVVIVSVFLIVGVAMLYSSAKVKKENIIDVLKQEII